MSLILHHLTPIHWAIAGASIALITLALMFLANRRLGLSTSFEDICSLALPLPYFQRKAVVSGRGWRLPFVGGLLLGGFLSAVLSGGWSPTMALGMFDETIGFGTAEKLSGCSPAACSSVSARVSAMGAPAVTASSACRISRSARS
jgi:hypothetical protein